MYICGGGAGMNVHAVQGQKRASDPIELEL